MRIYELVIEPGREEHIARHQVSVEEVEEVIFGVPFIRKAKLGRYHIIGQTEAGRYLTVFVAPRGQGVYGLVTAWSRPGHSLVTAWSQPEIQMMQSAERRAYLRHSKKKQP